MQKVFQGGSVGDLHRMLNVEDASTVLYVGDHIYGDILKSKKAMGWRTMVCHDLPCMLIVPRCGQAFRGSGVLLAFRLVTTTRNRQQ